MIHALLAAAAIAGILLFSELLWRRERIRSEAARKFVHILAGTVIAFLPFWVSYGWIVVLGVGFVLGNALNRYSLLFNAIHAIKRRTWGDLLFGVGVIVVAAFRPDAWIFAAAILHVAWADGLAAVIGDRFGKRYYRIFEHKKSVIGTCTFVIISFLVLLMTAMALHYGNSFGLWALLIATPLLTALLENVSGYGTDNITVPLAVLIVLSNWRF